MTNKFRDELNRLLDLQEGYTIDPNGCRSVQIEALTITAELQDDAETIKRPVQKPIKYLIDRGWRYHGADLYSFEDSGSMSGRDALCIQASCATKLAKLVKEGE